MDTPPMTDDVTTVITYSSEFNDEEAEIVYQSSDGLRFRIHAVYLKAHTEGLAPPDGSSFNEVVHLTESASILELLFKFIYPTRQPVLELEVEFETVKGLAEAAEKYQVFPVMYVCYLHMHSTLPNHALPILAYALKHDYPDLMDVAAPHVLDVPLSDIIDNIPSESYKAWFTYYCKWVDVQKRALTVHLPMNNPYAPTISSLAGKLSAFRDTNAIFSASPNNQWKNPIDSDINAIPKLSEIIGNLQSGTGSGQEGDDTRKENEVIIESPDGAQNYIDLSALHACATGFDDPLEGKIMVPEKSTTISLLLKFIKPVRSPDIKSLPFEELKDLTYAAEKYAIRQATGICRVFMKKTLPDHPADIFQYASRYRYLDILDLAAPLAIGPMTSFDDTISRLPPAFIAAWARFYQRWQEAARSVLSEIISQESLANNNNNYNGYNSYGYRQGTCSCGNNFMQSHLKQPIAKLLEGPGSLRDLDDIFPQNQYCNTTQTAFQKCREVAEKAIKDIPTLSSLL